MLLFVWQSKSAMLERQPMPMSLPGMSDWKKIVSNPASNATAMKIQYSVQ
jgi:hypothetical protein